MYKKKKLTIRLQNQYLITFVKELCIKMYEKQKLLD